MTSLHKIWNYVDFAFTWEQCELSDLGTIITGSTPPTSNSDYYSKSGIPWVTPTDINKNTTFDTSRRLSLEGEKVARVVPKDSILVTCIASIGKNTLLGVRGSFNQQINAIIPGENMDSYFLFSQSNHWSDSMKQMGNSLTFQIVNKTEFSKMRTMIPKYKEQLEIGMLFKSIDNLITLHQRKCIL